MSDMDKIMDTPSVANISAKERWVREKIQSMPTMLCKTDQNAVAADEPKIIHNSYLGSTEIE